MPVPDRDVYGVASMNDYVLNIESSRMYRSGSTAMIVMSHLSDAQEEIDAGLPDDARKTLNRAKFLVHRWFDTAQD